MEDLLAIIEEARNNKKRKPVPKSDFPKSKPGAIIPTAKNNKRIRRRKELRNSKSKGETEKSDLNEKLTKRFESEAVEKKLRTIGQPIKFFAESMLNKIKRLKLAELDLHEKKTSSKGTGNVFRDMQNKVEKDMQNDHAENQPQNSNSDLKSTTEIPFKTRNQFDSIEDFLLYFFKRLLLEWETDLKSLPLSEKRSLEAKNATAIQKQSSEYLKPFFTLLESRSCANDIIQPMELIVQQMQQREYVKANNEYLTMSIGNAPWPMGLTMVSIHERRGRHKICSNQIAHILNDEETRKYIQCVKRLLTFCQKRYPPYTVGKRF